MTIHGERLQRALIFTASRLLAAAQRDEWLADWLTELWYARTESPARATSFAIGGFADAWWLRRNPPPSRGSGPLLIDLRKDHPALPPASESRFLESPLVCLGLLGLFAAVAAGCALATGAADKGPPNMARGFALLIGTGLVILPATTQLSIGDYPARLHSVRRWGFFALKLVLILTGMVLGAMTVIGTGSPMLMEIGLWAGVWGSHLGVRWALADQRARCPVCLRRVGHPVRMGNSSRILLEWNGTELLCPRGHGLLHVPEQPAVWFTKQRWLRL